MEPLPRSWQPLFWSLEQLRKLVLGSENPEFNLGFVPRGCVTLRKSLYLSGSSFSHPISWGVTRMTCLENVPHQ